MKPCGLTFDLHGRLHVAAWGSNCIQVFTPEGVLLTNYGSETLSEPTGIAVNGEGCQSLVLHCCIHYPLWCHYRCTLSKKIILFSRG